MPSGSYNTRIDYHKAYTTLLEKIIWLDCNTLYFIYLSFCFSCESKSSRREPVHGGCTPSSPLTPTAQRLLTEFGLRYGIVIVSLSLSLSPSLSSPSSFLPLSLSLQAPLPFLPPSSSYPSSLHYMCLPPSLLPSPSLSPSFPFLFLG